MKILYSFVIDENMKYIRQAKIFVSNLLNAGVSSQQIVAHLTPSAPPAAEELLQKYEISYERIPFGPDKRFCNKIPQLFSKQVTDGDYDVLAVCDTDLAIIEKLDHIAMSDVIRARRVGGPNPPIQILDKLASILNVTEKPNFLKTNCTDEMSYEFNCNGGLLLIPKNYVEPVARLWLQHAEHLLSIVEVFERWNDNVDQVAWAFALMQLQLPYRELDITCNFPIGNAKLVENGYEMPIVLHHHNELDEDGLIKRTGIEIVDQAIERANRCVSKYY